MALLPLMLIVLVMIGVFFLMDQPRPWRALLITTVLTAFAILTLVWIVRATDSFSDGRAGLAALGMILLLAACVCVLSGFGAAIGQAPLAWRDSWPTINFGWIAAFTIVAYGGFRVLVWLDQGILG